MLKKVVGARLAQLRNEQGYSRKYVAQQLDINQTRLRDWEQGRYGVPIEYLAHLVEMYGTSADWLADLGGRKSMKEHNELMAILSELTDEQVGRVRDYARLIRDASTT